MGLTTLNDTMFLSEDNWEGGYQMRGQFKVVSNPRDN